MSLMLSKTYEAFRAAGAPEDKAQAAAEEIATYERDISEIKGDVRLVKWMVVLILVVEALPYLKTVFSS